MTTTNAQTAAEQSAGTGFTLVHPHILTNEFLLAYETGAFAGYCRMQCGLCHAFVRRLKTPVEFRSLKYFFPFIRLASVLEFPRTQENLPEWLQFAFQAGLELGDAHPEAADEILPDHVLAKARSSLASFKKMLDDTAPQADEIGLAFAQLAERQWPQIDPLEMNQVYCETAVRAMRAGYFAATLALADPCLATFAEDLPRAPRDDTDLIQRALLDACRFEWDAALACRMEHPLLRIARQLHRHDAVRQERLLSIASASLHAASVYGEDEDPTPLLPSYGFEDCEATAQYRGRNLECVVRTLDGQLRG